MTWGRYRRCSEEANSFRAAGGVESGQVRLGSAQGRGISAVKAAAAPVPGAAASAAAAAFTCQPLACCRSQSANRLLLEPDIEDISNIIRPHPIL